MSARRRLAIVRAIVAKDLREFARDRVWMILTPVMIVAYVALFWLLPDRTEETLSVGVYGRGLDAVIEALDTNEGPGLALVAFDSPEALERAVEARDPVVVGIAFPDDLLAAIAAGRRTTVTLYVDASVPGEIRTAIRALVREVAFQLAGVGLPVTEPAAELVVLGEDRVGRQVSIREQMRPMLALFVLVVESIALAGLVAVELQARTARAITVTPATVGDLLAAKAVTGTLLAFGQAVLVLLLVAGLATEPLLMLFTVLVASVMMAGIGMLAGSAGRDFMATLFSSVVFLIPLLIPAFAALFPGTASVLVQVLPTYGVVQVITGVTAYGLDWAGAAGYLAMSAAWCVALLAAGWFVLRRRIEAR